MKLIITMDINNAAFDGDAAAEAARSIRQSLDTLEAGETELYEGILITLRDYNGNRVGILTVVD